MVPVGTGAKASWSPAISLCWRCRLTARSSIRSSGFGTICAATGSPTRYFVAWRTSWTPARWRGTGSPPTTAWSAHSARSPGLRLRPLYSGARVVPAIEPWPETKDTLLSRNFRRSVLLSVRIGLLWLLRLRPTLAKLVLLFRPGGLLPLRSPVQHGLAGGSGELTPGFPSMGARKVG